MFDTELIRAFTRNITKLLTMKSFYYLVIKHLLTKHSLKSTTLGHVLWSVSLRSFGTCTRKNLKRREKEKGNKRKKKNATKKHKQLVRSSIFFFFGYISYTDFINYASKYGSFNFLDYIRQIQGTDHSLV